VIITGSEADGKHSSRELLIWEREADAKKLAFCRVQSHGTPYQAGKLTTNTLACHHTQEKKTKKKNSQAQMVKVTY